MSGAASRRSGRRRAPGDRCRPLRASGSGVPWLRPLLLGAGWLIASPFAGAEPPKGAASIMEDAGLRAVHDSILTGLQAMPELDHRAIGAVETEGRCDFAAPCRAEAASVLPTVPPLQVSTIACEVTVAFDGHTLVATTIEGLGRGSTCEAARRDAPMQVADRLLKALKEEVLDWSRKRRLVELGKTLETLDRGTTRLRPPPVVTDAPLEAMEVTDEVLRTMEQ